MDEGIDDTSDLYNDAYDDEASGKNSARRSMNIPTPKNDGQKSATNALKSSEKSAASAAGKSVGGGTGAAAAKLAEKAGSLYTGKGKPAAAKSGQGFGGKLKGASKKPIVWLLIALVVIVGIIAFAGQALQPFSWLANVNIQSDKLSALFQPIVESYVVASVESTDPDDGLNEYMQRVLADYGLDYVENQNSDGTVARALIYRGDDNSTTLIASEKVKDNLLNTLRSTGSIIDNYRSLATVGGDQDAVDAALQGATNFVATAAHFDGSAALTYERHNTDPGKFNAGSANLSNEEIVELARAGSASEDVNNTSGVTKRYTWNRHTYQYCVGWEWISTPYGGYWHCNAWADGEVWDWDSESGIGGRYSRPTRTDDPFPTKENTAAETCKPWDGCPGKLEQTESADPEAFSGSDIATKITRDDDESAVQDALSKRNVLSAFSSSPYGKKDNSSTKDNYVLKSDNTINAALVGLVKNKTINFAQSFASAIDQTKAGDDGGGTAVNYYSNLINTPAKSYAADGTEVSNIAATASTSWNKWFSPSVEVDPENKIVKKYNIKATLDNLDVESITIKNERTGNYNNMDNTNNSGRQTENMDNTIEFTKENEKGEVEEVLYYYCEYSSGANVSLCPLDPYRSKDAETLYPSELQISDDVATYAHALTSIDFNSDPAGEEAAVALNEGIALLTDDLLKQSSGIYGDKESVTAFYNLQQNYIARQANYDRQTKSPFDTSSPHTFLGSIVSNLTSFATSHKSNPLFSTIAAASNVVGSTATSLLPSAGAYTLDTLLYIDQSTTTENCVAHDSTGMLCDIYGNPIATVDVAFANNTNNGTVQNQISDAEQKMVTWGYVLDNTCNTDEGCEVNEEYDKNNPNDQYSYTKWLMCTQNDATINNGLSTETSTRNNSGQGSDTSEGGGFLSGLISKIIRGVVDFFKGSFSSKEGENSVRNQISCGGDYGESQNNNNMARDGVTVAEQYKVFSAFTIGQRAKALMKYQKESAATAYLRKYYAEHPLDQSFEAVIARSAGLTVAEVKQAFADMEYAVYIARYDSSSRYQFGWTAPSQLEFALSQTDFDTMKIAAIVGKIQNFEELKDRNFAA